MVLLGLLIILTLRNKIVARNGSHATGFQRQRVEYFPRLDRRRWFAISEAAMPIASSR